MAAVVSFGTAELSGTSVSVAAWVVVVALAGAALSPVTASVLASTFVSAWGVSSSFDEAGVSVAVMCAPWSFGGNATKPVRLWRRCCYPLSYAPVGWGREPIVRVGILCFVPLGSAVLYGGLV